MSEVRDDGRAATTGAAEALAGVDPGGASLDPPDWPAFRAQAHRMLDDILDFTRDIRERPVWTPAPAAVRSSFREALPQEPTALATVHSRFLGDILPFTAGNTHPGFMGWVQGGGTPVGTLAEMLAAGLNANLGGRDQIPIEVERQVVHWMRELFDFPATASGLFVTGTSIANFMAVLVARTAALGPAVRQTGVDASARRVAYASAGAHGCIAQALDLAGLGKDALRSVPTNARFEIDTAALEAMIAADRAAGCAPFLVVGTAGTVDVGAVDDLAALATLSRREGLWLHVDGAYGALARLSPALAPRLAGIERADSIAFDFHKWAQVPYDAGFLLVRDGRLHQETFASPAAYLRRESRGLAAGSPWPCDFGPDLSRGFRALKTWFTFQVHGAAAIGRAIENSCALARHLAARIDAEPALERLAPVGLNIVCFRFRGNGSGGDALNAEIVVALQTSGLCAPSSTTVAGQFAIRAAIVNHRTVRADVDRLVDATLEIGRRLSGGAARLRSSAHWLLEGGDERLAVDPASGRNRYGCTPEPEPALASFGSSTATAISAPGFKAAERLRGWLVARGDGAVLERRGQRAAGRIAEALKQYCGVADLPGLGVTLAASGTDLHRLAVSRLLASAERPPLVLMMAAAETGSGVAQALAGEGGGAEVRQVELRLGHGALRSRAEVQEDIGAHVEHAVGAGRRVLLVPLDVSKTGLLAPGADFVVALRERHRGHLDVLVDACQFRLCGASVRRYLAHGFQVALTGSKFLTGPSFSGALLDPSGHPAAESAVNIGLLLRWTAALAEFDAFRRVPPAALAGFLDAFAAAVGRRLDTDAAFEPLPTHPLARGAGFDADAWDTRPTVFPFLLHRPGGSLLSREETLAVYRRLPESTDPPGVALRCQLGQPVFCGRRGGVEIAALRLCLGARQIVEATAHGGLRAQAVIDRALAVLDRAAELAAATRPVRPSTPVAHA